MCFTYLYSIFCIQLPETDIENPSINEEHTDKIPITNNTDKHIEKIVSSIQNITKRNKQTDNDFDEFYFVENSSTLMHNQV